MGKRGRVALLSLSSWRLVSIVWLFLAMPWVCLQFEIVVFPDHTHLLFRNNRSTIDQLTRLESAIKEGQLNDKKVIAVFIDLKKAFDLLWRNKVILKLTQFRIKSKMLRWINDILLNSKN